MEEGDRTLQKRKRSRSSSPERRVPSSRTQRNEDDFVFLLSHLPVDIYEELSHYLPIQDQMTMEQVSKSFIPASKSKKVNFIKMLKEYETFPRNATEKQIQNIRMQRKERIREFLVHLPERIQKGEITKKDLSLIYSDKIPSTVFVILFEQIEPRLLFELLLNYLHLENVWESHFDDYMFLKILREGTMSMNANDQQRFFNHYTKIEKDLRTHFENKTWFSENKEAKKITKNLLGRMELFLNPSLTRSMSKYIPENMNHYLTILRKIMLEHVK